MKWKNPRRVLGASMSNLLNPKEMLQAFVKCGLLTEISGDYSQDVYMMCRNGATWLGAQMARYGYEVEVVEGTYEGDSHCWVALNNTYFDMTIAQSDPTFPEFAIIKQKDAIGYEEFMRFSVPDWMQKCLTN